MDAAFPLPGKGKPDIVWPALRASEGGPWLWSRRADLLWIAGGGSLLLTAAAVPASAAWPGLGAAAGAVFLYLPALCNSPHYAATYHVVWRERESRPRAWRFLLWSLPVVGAASAAALLRPEALIPSVRQLYLTLSAHHYASQHFGVAAMYAARAERPLEPAAKRLAQLAFLAAGAFLMIVVNTRGAGPVPEGGWAAVLPHGVLPPGAYAAALAAGAVSLASYAAAEIVSRRRAGRGLEGTTRLLYLTSLVWFVVPNLRLPGADRPWPSPALWVTLLAVFPFFHCLQYLGVTAHRERLSGPVRPVYLFSALVLGGALLFQASTAALSGLGVATAIAAGLLVEAVVNLHHYFVDALIWRRREERP